MTDSTPPPAGAQNATATAFEPIVVVSTNVTASELAAITAVVHGVLAEESDSLRAQLSRGTSAWHRSQRALRSPLEPGPGRWNG